MRIFLKKSNFFKILTKSKNTYAIWLMNSNLKKRKIEGNLKNVFLNTYIYSLLLLFFIIYLTNKKKRKFNDSANKF